MGLVEGSCMKYVTVAILTAINLLNYVDRYTIAGLSPSSLPARFSFHVYLQES